MKSFFFLLPILFLAACTAIDGRHDGSRSSSWVSSDPLSIPLSLRQAQFEKGNLVQNASFEQGDLSPDGLEGQSSPKDWEIIGNNVSWLQQTLETDDSTETNSGLRSIKVSRSTVSEMAVEEGVISDFIPVIPGNYDFTYHIRLKNITNHRSRLGVRLHDAIAIRIFYFDENQQPVDSGYLNPIGNGPIDNGDKSFSFSNYWRIDDFPWGKVRGRTYNYPYSEGDIPDSARYVRLFFGLKGKGTLWLDDVYYAYSKWNFTALERFFPYFGRQLTPAERVIPTPKYFSSVGDHFYFKDNSPKSQLPVILLPDTPAPAERTAARLLQNTINAMLNRLLPVDREGDLVSIAPRKDIALNGRGDPRLILSIGDSRFYQRVKPQLPLADLSGKPQAYLIKGVRIRNTLVVFLLGETPLGTYYASTTAAQLFAHDSFVYHNATVLDFPDFSERPYVFKNWTQRNQIHKDLGAVERMSFLKLNKVYFGYNRKKKTWYAPDALCREGLTEAGRVFKNLGVMNLALMVNPYSHFPMEASIEDLKGRDRHLWTHADPESFVKLEEVLSIGLQAGADTVMLLSDDFVPHSGTNRQDYSLYTEEDQRRFVNLQNAQAHIINRLKQWLDGNFPGTRLVFCPPWYSNEHVDRSNGKAEWYFRDLMFQIPGDVAVIWTGPTIRSLSIDEADLYRYRSLIGRWPMLWDNTLYARNIENTRYGGYAAHYPGKVRMCNLFEPYDTIKPKRFHNYTDGRKMYINGNAHSEVYKIKYATVADYAWNTAAYNPELSLWKILCRSYGLECAQELIRFSDTYYHLYGMLMLMEKKGPDLSSIEDGETVLSELDARLLEVSRLLSDQHILVKELTRFRDKQKARLAKISRVE